MRTLAVTLIALGAGTAHADDHGLTMNLGISGLALGSSNPDFDVVGESGPRLTLAWEDPPLAYPDRRGNRYDGALVPELIAGAMMGDDKAELVLGGGLRAELKMAQVEGGALRLTCRGAGYFAARMMVIGERRDLLGEASIGEYIYIGAPLRIGFDVGMVARKTGAMNDGLGVVTQLYLGWGPRTPVSR